MKFTVSQALETIKAKLATAGGTTTKQKLSDRSITETVENLLQFATDEMELEAFIGIVFPIIDTNNNNAIKDQSDFVKDYSEKNPVLTADEILKQQQEADAAKKAAEEAAKGVMTPEAIAKLISDGIAEGLKPLQAKAIEDKTKETLEARSIAIKEKAKALKLSKEWGVDFSKSVQLAELQSGPDASADDVYAKALADFNSTLSQRGETYVPQKEDAGPAKTFDAAADKQRKIDNGTWKGPVETK